MPRKPRSNPTLLSFLGLPDVETVEASEQLDDPLAPTPEEIAEQWKRYCEDHGVEPGDLEEVKAAWIMFLGQKRDDTTRRKRRVRRRLKPWEKELNTERNMKLL